MSECMWLSDRMPEVALGRAMWSPDEARHLGECRECQEEWELVSAAGRLGEDMVFAPDAQRTSNAVLRRLQQDERKRPMTLVGLGLGAAAAVIAMLWAGGRIAPNGGLGEAAPAVAGLQIPLPELEDLQAAELDSVLNTMDEPGGTGAGADTTDEAPDLGDLNTDELQRVLDSWEG